MSKPKDPSWTNRPWTNRPYTVVHKVSPKPKPHSCWVPSGKTFDAGSVVRCDECGQFWIRSRDYISKSCFWREARFFEQRRLTRECGGPNVNADC